MAGEHNFQSTGNRLSLKNIVRKTLLTTKIDNVQNGHYLNRGGC